MKRKKRELTATIRKLTEENAERILNKYTKRSCRGAVGLFFDIVPGMPVPVEVAREALTDEGDYPDALLMFTKGVVKDGKIEGTPQDPDEYGRKKAFLVPIAIIRPGINVSWHEWVQGPRR